MPINSNPAPYHMQQAIDLLAESPTNVPVWNLARAGVHAILAVADAIERQTKTTIAIDNERSRTQ